MRFKLLILILFLIFCSSGIFSQKVRNYIKENLYEEGINYYENVLKQNDLSTAEKKDAYNNLMQLYVENSRLLKKFLEVTAVSNSQYYEIKKNKNYKPSDAFSVLTQGFCSFEREDYKSAKEYFKKAIDAKYETAGYKQIAGIWLGAAYYLIGDKNAAYDIWKAYSKNEIKIRSELAYIYARLNIESDQIRNIIKEIPDDISDDRVIRNILQCSAELEDYTHIRKLISKINLNYPLFIKNKGSITEEIFYDPSVYSTISSVNSYLSFYFANMLNSLTAPDEQEKYNTKYYRGLYYFNSGKYNEAIYCLNNSTGSYSQLLLANSLYKNNNSGKANELFNKLEKNNDPVFLSELGYSYTLNKIKGKAQTAFSLLNEAYKRVLESDSREIQKVCLNLARYYIITKQYSLASDYLAKNFKYNKIFSLAGNPPCYRLEYAASYIYGGNFSRFEEINLCITPIEENYNSAKQLREVLRRIDVITKNGLESSIMNK